MEFFTSPVVSNIVNLISLLATIISIVQGIKKDKSTEDLSHTEEINVEIYSTQNKKGKLQIDSTVVTMLMLILGYAVYPYRNILSVVFALFWWLVIVVQFRFSHKRLFTAKGHNLRLILQIEVIFDIAAFLVIDQIPKQIYLGIPLAEKIFPVLIAGLLASAYIALFLLGLLSIAFSLAKDNTDISAWIGDTLRRFWKAPAKFIFVAAAAALLLTLLHFAGIG